MARKKPAQVAGITPRAVVENVVTEEILGRIPHALARRLAFNLALAAFGAAWVILAVVLLFSDYTHKPGSAGVIGVFFGFGGAALLASMAIGLVFRSRKNLPAPKYVMPPKTPETILDAWLGTGIMAGVATVILILAAIFGGPDRLANMLRFMPLATLGPGSIAGLFLITGYTVGNREKIFARWLAKRPIAAAEYAELQRRAAPGTGASREP